MVRKGWDMEPGLSFSQVEQDGVSRNSGDGASQLQHSMECRGLCQHLGKEDLHAETVLQQSAPEKENFGDERKQQGRRSWIPALSWPPGPLPNRSSTFCQVGQKSPTEQFQTSLGKI